MKAIKIPIGLTTLTMFTYLISIYTGAMFPLIFALFLLLNGLTIWMVIRILKDGTPSDASFDEQWYEDAPKLPD